MLHNQDSDMLLLDPTNKGSVFRMDLEYGKVVDEWKVSDAVDVNNIIPDTKYAQMNPQQTLIGHCESPTLRQRLECSMLMSSAQRALPNRSSSCRQQAGRESIQAVRQQE